MFKRGLIVGIVTASLLLSLVACQSNNSGKTTITLSVAASLKEAMEDIQREFEAENPDIKLQINLGASGALAKQIEQGAPVDIFFSAGIKQMEDLKASNHVSGENIKNILENKLVLITSKENDIVTSFENLTSDEIEKLAVGESESVPVGQYTMEVLDNLNLVDRLADKFVYAKDVREVLTWVETRNADAGIVYETDAKISSGVKIVEVAKEGLHKPVIYPIAAISASENLEEAQKLIEYIQEEKSEAIFERYGFSPVTN